MGKEALDLTGQKFGKLTVINREKNNKYGHTTWKCRCDCGNETIVVGSRLLHGRTRSCSSGCLKIIDLTGKKYGKWTILEKGTTKKNQEINWLCKCDCGTIKEVRSSDLRNGISTSCGCGNKLEEGESACRWLYNHYKYDAKKRGYFFNLTLEEFKIITKKDCHHCGNKPSQITQRKKYSNSNGEYVYNGIDRLDNTKGYTKENSVPCCGECNRLKSNNTHQDFLNHIEKISNEHKKGLLYEKENNEKDTTYSSIWTYRKGKMIHPFKDNINKENPYYSEFNPLVSQNITNFWSKKDDIIIDPFAGRTRGIISGLTHRKYYGFEISKQVYDKVQEVIKEGENKFDDGYKPIIYNDDSFNINNYKHIPKADLIFSCPPYWNLEKYPSCEGQLSDIKDYEKFLLRLKKIMEKCCDKLKDDGFICLVIGNFRIENGNKLLSMDCDITKMMESIPKIVLWDKIVLQNVNFGHASKRFGSIKHKKITAKVSEYLLVFKKIK